MCKEENKLSKHTYHISTQQQISTYTQITHYIKSSLRIVQFTCRFMSM